MSQHPAVTYFTGIFFPFSSDIGHFLTETSCLWEFLIIMSLRIPWVPQNCLSEFLIVRQVHAVSGNSSEFSKTVYCKWVPRNPPGAVSGIPQRLPKLSKWVPHNPTLVLSYRVFLGITLRAVSTSFSESLNKLSHWVPHNLPINCLTEFLKISL